MNKAKTLAVAIIALFAGASLSLAGFGDLADMAKKKAAEEAKKQATEAAVKMLFYLAFFYSVINEIGKVTCSMFVA